MSSQKKYIAGSSLLGLLLLVAGVVAGIVLVMQPQLLNQSAADVSYANCTGSASLSCGGLGGTVNGVNCSGYGTCHLSGDYNSCDPVPGTNTCKYRQSNGTYCVSACPATMPAGYARCQCNNGVTTIGYLPSGGSCDTLCKCTGNYCTTCTPNPTPTPTMSTIRPTPTPTPRVTPSRTPTRTPTGTPTRTPSRTPTGSPPRTPTGTPSTTSCINWVIDEHSGSNSQLVKVNAALTSVSDTIKYYDCNSGLCEFENLTVNRANGKVYSSPNKGSTQILYEVNVKQNDNIADGTLARVAVLDKNLLITGLSFRPSDGSLWAWVQGTSTYKTGLYQINMSTGATTLVFESNLVNVEDIAWDNSGAYLYFTRTPYSATPKWSNYELHRYTPGTNSSAYWGALPGKTDGMGMAPSNYLNGLLVGSYSTGSNSSVMYTYNVSTKTVVKKYPLSSSHSNFDAMAICVPQ